MTDEQQKMAPGLIQAFNPEESEEPTDGRRRGRNQDDPITVSYTHLTLPTNREV